VVARLCGPPLEPFAVNQHGDDDGKEEDREHGDDGGAVHDRRKLLMVRVSQMMKTTAPMVIHWKGIGAMTFRTEGHRLPFIATQVGGVVGVEQDDPILHPITRST
jgi:hypothetical protein